VNLEFRKTRKQEFLTTENAESTENRRVKGKREV
jgi:hypothetical protein